MSNKLISLPRIFISAPRKSSGKTTLSLGLAYALKRRNLHVRVFKKGPDFIDPMWHRAATGIDCPNLDSFLMGEDRILQNFQKNAHEMDINIIEGNHGLHDGLDPGGKDSSAGLAKLLQSPVILIVDSTGMNRGIAALVLGQQLLDKGVRVEGVVINNVRSPRQEAKQIAAIENYCGIPVIGALPVSTPIQIKERHLGLQTVMEAPEVATILENVGNLIEAHLDLDKVLAISREAPLLTPVPIETAPCPPAAVKIGIARDEAFSFYYPENLKSLELAGAELIYFNALTDDHLPEIDGLYLGGGFPECFLDGLEQNKGLRQEIKAAIENDLPVYAECGGLIYLCRKIDWNGIERNMVGAIPADVVIDKKPVGFGYIELVPTLTPTWFKIKRQIKAHEFHYSRLVNLDEKIDFFYRVTRGSGVIKGELDGIVYKNLLASYAHLHSEGVPEWANDFVAFVKEKRKSG